MFFGAQGVLPDPNKVMVWQEFFVYGQNDPFWVMSSSFQMGGSTTNYSSQL